LKQVCVVTEYAEGELFQVLEDDGSLPEQQVTELSFQIKQIIRFLFCISVYRWPIWLTQLNFYLITTLDAKISVLSIEEL